MAIEGSDDLDKKGNNVWATAANATSVDITCARTCFCPSTCICTYAADSSKIRFPLI